MQTLRQPARCSLTARLCVTLVLLRFAAPYIHQCSWSDPKVTECFIQAMMHIRPWLAQGELATPKEGGLARRARPFVGSESCSALALTVRLAPIRAQASPR